MPSSLQHRRLPRYLFDSQHAFDSSSPSPCTERGSDPGTRTVYARRDAPPGVSNCLSSSGSISPPRSPPPPPPPCASVLRTTTAAAPQAVPACLASSGSFMATTDHSSQTDPTLELEQCTHGAYAPRACAAFRCSPQPAFMRCPQKPNRPHGFRHSPSGSARPRRSLLPSPTSPAP
ncbi:hypothetical protein PYCCODRAFT_1437181 [Trametes coccinea BRFM310]|uniref:Uncharacterized protein n=1 Tax=Trametes coccinea (strain BRFM310) TaxID=1353009 RepID=A0A1Y2IJ79_TRAC3|nr:hypothetical protein PYCCODRAFT_1437181 [Trametes coccinea BRFM310]